MGDRAVLDQGALARLHRIGGNDFVIEMIELFLENAPLRLQAAREAFEGDDVTTLHRSVHSLKSTAANLGARSLQNTAEAAEARASAKDMEALPPLLDDLDRQYEQARGELEAERERRQGAGGSTEEPK